MSPINIKLSRDASRLKPFRESMNTRIIVSGTDTDIGKTIFAAGLTQLLDGYYLKPVQSGLEGETDTAVVQRLTQLPPERLLPEVYRLSLSASPHLSAEGDGLRLDPDYLYTRILEYSHGVEAPLIIEGAGGLMVPLTRSILYIDVFARLQVPVVLCARTGLGTLNHTLLSIEALKHRGIPLLGLALIGDKHEDNERTLVEMGGVPLLGRLPRLDPA